MKHLNILVESLVKKETVINKKINESLSYDKLHTLKVLNKIKSNIKNPSDIEKFIGKYNDQIMKVEEELSGQPKKNLTSAFSKLKYAVSKGWQFIKRHWGKILALILIITFALFFKFGLFGKFAGIIGSWLGSGGNDTTLIDTNTSADNDVDINIDNTQIDNTSSTTPSNNNALDTITGSIPTGNQIIHGYYFNVTPEDAEYIKHQLETEYGVTDQNSFEKWAKSRNMLKSLRPVPIVDIKAPGRKF